MNYHNINHCDFLNGEGIRVSLWISGCCIHCKGCQNPQTWNFKSGIEFTNNDLEELLNALKQPYIKGLTLTGGNPLDNSCDILNICKTVKKELPKKDIWLYSGYTLEEIEQDPIKNLILKYIDILIDGPYIEEKRDISLHWRGSSNQRIINVQETLKQNKVILYDED